MAFTVNAWLERKKPYLEVRERESDRKILYLEGDSLKDWLRGGDVSVSELSSNESTQEVIRELLIKSILTPGPRKSRSYSLGLTYKTADNIIHFPILRTLIQRCTVYKKIYVPKIICFRSRKLRLLERLHNNKHYNNNKG